MWTLSVGRQQVAKRHDCAILVKWRFVSTCLAGEAPPFPSLFVPRGIRSLKGNNIFCLFPFGLVPALLPLLTRMMTNLPTNALRSITKKYCVGTVGVNELLSPHFQFHTLHPLGQSCDKDSDRADLWRGGVRAEGPRGGEFSAEGGAFGRCSQALGDDSWRRAQDMSSGEGTI